MSTVCLCVSHLVWYVPGHGAEASEPECDQIYGFEDNEGPWLLPFSLWNWPRGMGVQRCRQRGEGESGALPSVSPGQPTTLPAGSEHI